MPALSESPLVIAHRGASAYAPENTFAAFDLAIEMGATAVETDVQATADGRLVLLHDARLDRTTSGHGELKEALFAEVETLDAGAWFDPLFAGQVDSDVGVVLGPLRAPVAPAPGGESSGRWGDELLHLVEAAGLLDEVEFTSFTLDYISQLTARAPTAKIGYLVESVDTHTVGETIGIGARLISGRAAALTPEAIEDARRAGLAVSAWGVDDDRLLAKVIALGVDSFTTNWPDRALQALRK